jgi:hypothetical protein
VVLEWSEIGVDWDIFGASGVLSFIGAAIPFRELKMLGVYEEEGSRRVWDIYRLRPRCHLLGAEDDSWIDMIF